MSNHSECSTQWAMSNSGECPTQWAVERDLSDDEADSESFNPFATVASKPRPAPSDVGITRKKRREAGGAGGSPPAPQCRLCHEDDLMMPFVRPCPCPTRVHVACLDQHRLLSVLKFYRCDDCGWPYEFAKDPKTYSETPAQETNEARQRARRWVEETIRGPVFCYMAVTMIYVLIARLIRALDPFMMLAVWTRANMDVFTEAGTPRAPRSYSFFLLAVGGGLCRGRLSRWLCRHGRVHGPTRLSHLDLHSLCPAANALCRGHWLVPARPIHHICAPWRLDQGRHLDLEPVDTTPGTTAYVTRY